MPTGNERSLPLLDIRDFGVRHGREALLEGVSLRVRRGSVHVLVGPNGAGKSTLISGILGRTPFSGTITANWISSGRIGYLPQSFAVDRSLPITVSDFLALARQKRPVCLGIARHTQRRIETMLAAVGLEDLARRQLSVLSGGELRRVLLANAIDPTPELLILDEPSTGLDEMAAAKMEEILVELNQRSGTTILMVSHDLDQVRRLAERVTVLNRSVQADGPPAEILTADLLTILLGMRRPLNGVR